MDVFKNVLLDKWFCMKCIRNTKQKWSRLLCSRDCHSAYPEHSNKCLLKQRSLLNTAVSSWIMKHYRSESGQFIIIKASNLWRISTIPWCRLDGGGGAAFPLAAPKSLGCEHSHHWSTAAMRLRSGCWLEGHGRYHSYDIMEASTLLRTLHYHVIFPLPQIKDHFTGTTLKKTEWWVGVCEKKWPGTDLVDNDAVSLLPRRMIPCTDLMAWAGPSCGPAVINGPCCKTIRGRDSPWRQKLQYVEKMESGLDAFCRKGVRFTIDIRYESCD